ncbi:MAG TPA: TlpA disulfide reductase family protein [Gemmatimonadaceae bacterium]|nr:TlpA disulfide reductase family protein [Gemmatimonadaceae bacterium]
MRPTRRSTTDPTRIARGLISLAALALSAAGAQAQKVGPGSASPEIDLPTLDGGHVKLSALKGHPVVITFWGTWCPPCREEFPELVAAQKQYRDAGLVVLAVNQRDQELTTKAVQDFVNEFGVDFIVALDGRGRARRSFRLIGLPTTIFLDAAGLIRAVHPGPISHAELSDALAVIVAAK